MNASDQVTAYIDRLGDWRGALVSRKVTASTRPGSKQLVRSAVALDRTPARTRSKGSR